MLCFCFSCCCCCLPCSVNAQIIINLDSVLCLHLAPCHAYSTARLRPLSADILSLSVCVCWPSLGNFNCNFCFLLAQLATPSLSLSPLSGNVCNIFVEISLKMTWKSLLSTQFSLVFRDDAVAPAQSLLPDSFIHSFILIHC